MINVFFGIEGSAVSDIAAGVIGNDRDIIAHLVLIWVAEEWVERIADGGVGRPGVPSVEAVGIEKL